MSHYFAAAVNNVKPGDTMLCHCLIKLFALPYLREKSRIVEIIVQCISSVFIINLIAFSINLWLLCWKTRGVLKQRVLWRWGHCILTKDYIRTSEGDIRVKFFAVYCNNAC